MPTEFEINQEGVPEDCRLEDLKIAGAAADRGEFASDEEVTALLAKYVGSKD